MTEVAERIERMRLLRKIDLNSKMVVSAIIIQSFLVGMGIGFAIGMYIYNTLVVALGK